MCDEIERIGETSGEVSVENCRRSTAAVIRYVPNAELFRLFHCAPARAAGALAPLGARHPLVGTGGRAVLGA